MRRRRGVALASAMLALMTMSVMVWIFVNITHQAWFASRRMTDGLRAYYAAEGGIRYAVALVEAGASLTPTRTVVLGLGESRATISIGGQAISSTGVYRGASRTIALQLSSEGAVLSRSEL